MAMSLDSPKKSKDFSPRKTKHDYVFLLWSKLNQKTNTLINDKNMQFEHLTEFITNKKIIELTANFWNVLNSFANQTKLRPKNKEDNTKARIIFTALLMAKFPHEVLDDMKDLDPLSEECYKNSIHVTDLLFLKQEIGKDFVTRLNCDEVVHGINAFHEIFISWKNKDVKKVLDSLLNFYKQWIRSKKVLSKTSMNEMQRENILKQINSNIANLKRKILRLIKNEKEMNRICSEIDQCVQNEPDLVAPTHNNHNNEEKKEDESNELTMEQKLAAKGIPMNIKTGRNLLQEMPRNPYQNNNNEGELDEDNASKYMKNVNGVQMMDLSMIVMEEAHKKYWKDFEKEIEAENYNRLLELLTELLQRLKNISPKKDEKYLDEMIDISFLQQMIENKLIDAKSFYSIFYGIWSQIKSLHSAAEDKEWQEWHDMIYKEMSSSTATWSTLLPKIFNQFFVKLDRIEAFIEAFQKIKQEKSNNDNGK